MKYEELKQKIKDFPDRPGIYFFKNSQGEVIYIGKARSLRNRVKNYFLPQPDLKVQNILSETDDIDYLLVSSEKEASFIENNYIQFYRPKFNLRLKDDKSFPFLKLTVNDDFPGLSLTRRVEDDGAKYFGPFSPADDARKMIAFLTRAFQLRTCENSVFKGRRRPCLEYDLKMCSAPCVRLISCEAYRQEVDQALLLLEGRKTELELQLRQKMDQAAQGLKFEQAAHWRDTLRSLERFKETQRVISTGKENMDIVGYARQGEQAAVFIFHMRTGRIRSSSGRSLGNLPEGEGQNQRALSQALLTFYDRQELPDRILLPFRFKKEETEALCYQYKIRNTNVRLLYPDNKRRKFLLELAEQNASLMLPREEPSSPMAELSQVLGLDRTVRRIEGLDISNTAGDESVGSIVVFEHGLPVKSEYRKYRLKTVSGPDDFASIREVLSRRLERLLEEKRPLPDLIFVDGGKGQLSAALQVLKNINLKSIPVCSLAKKEEIIFSERHPAGLRLDPTSGALKLLQQIRDEAHRFAISFHRQRRTKKSFASQLYDIPGLGPIRKKKLLLTFGHLDGIRKASYDELARVVGPKLAQIIKQTLGNTE
ncbi:MAG TPA: excinuclease ABC subunit UvrC [Candidatus Saccharicenans sp.]|jgi:excinuclease ABC subunit C|nr:excinuclease ABC subunit UvrC [Candidatus Saccharicenans sp.]HRD01266.1 excinuclease ABC subunit UvrC [Candidatus Saccharicenans sp.]